MMNTMKLTETQTAYLIKQVSNDASLMAICQNASKNQEAFDKVMSMIGGNIFAKLTDKIKPAVLVKASSLDDAAKCRMVLESWWTLDEIEPQTIRLFLMNGDFDTKQHRAWLADVFGGKKVNDSFMFDLECLYSEALYAILYK